MQNRKRDTDVQNRLLDSVGEGEGGMFWENSVETSILSRVKQITSPGWMHVTSAQGWCTGKTQRDGMGSEAGEGIGMGNTCKSQYLLQYCKVISLQLIKINEKKEKCPETPQQDLLEITFKVFSNRTAIWPSNPTAGHTHRGNQIWKTHVHPSVHHSTVYNSQDMEAT